MHAPSSKTPEQSHPRAAGAGARMALFLNEDDSTDEMNREDRAKSVSSLGSSHSLGKELAGLTLL